MALFIAGPALEGELLNHAKIGIMIGSLLSAGAGMAILLLLSRGFTVGADDSETRPDTRPAEHGHQGPHGLNVGALPVAVGIYFPILHYEE